MVLTAGNWNRKDDDYSEMFILQNLKQFWLPEEISLSNDTLTWKKLTQDERDTYSKVLAGLTLLDSLQGDVGMPDIARHVSSHQKKAVFTFMGGMETAVHARSYSNIFLTLEPSKRINELFEWVKENPYLQKKGTIIKKYYDEIVDNYTLAKAMSASVALETFLFYSGFYYPLYLAGQGKMTTSGEIIRKILLDESIHGVFTGLDAQSLRNELSENEKQKADKEMYKLLEELYKNEVSYTHMLYDDIGLTEDVLNYVQYNGNKALSNLGFEPYFEEKEFNPIIENALDTSTKNHDFFSVKGDGYTLALNVEALQDEDFIFED